MLYCKTYREAYKMLNESLGSQLEARELILHATKKDYNKLSDKDLQIPVEQLNILENLLERRLLGEPLQYIIGMWEFYNLPFYVGEGVLIPREDTAVLIDTVLQLNTASNPEIVDLCAGTGCIGIVLSKLIKGSNVTGVELSTKAYDYLEKNVKLNNANITIANGDALTYKHLKPIDFLVSNPPYIPTQDLDTLQLEVKKEPALALDGGADGLDFYRSISREFYPQILCWKLELIS